MFYENICYGVYGFCFKKILDMIVVVVLIIKLVLFLNIIVEMIMIKEVGCIFGKIENGIWFIVVIVVNIVMRIILCEINVFFLKWI